MSTMCCNPAFDYIGTRTPDAKFRNMSKRICEMSIRPHSAGRKSSRMFNHGKRLHGLVGRHYILHVVKANYLFAGRNHQKPLFIPHSVCQGFQK